MKLFLIILITIFSFLVPYKYQKKNLRKISSLLFCFIWFVVFLITILTILSTYYLIKFIYIEALIFFDTGFSDSLGYVIIFFIFWFPLILFFIGLILECIEYDIDKYYSFIKKIGNFFYIPFVMISFELFLIYLLINEEIETLYIFIISLILILTGITILFYFKNLFKKKENIN